jgi:rhodanese-related sulfurtransferase
MAPSKPPRKRLKKRTVILLLVLAGVLGGLLWDGSPLGALILRQAVHLKFRDVRQVTPEEMVTWMRDVERPPPLLVDARPEEQYGMSHIQGSVRLDPVKPDLEVFTHVSRDQPLVVYDAAGVVGTAMVVGLTQAGFSRVSNLDGGIFRWANEAHPIVSDSGAATKVHPVSWWWGRLLKARYRP